MDKREIFKKFLETNEVLIVDKNPSSRNRLSEIICNLGAARKMVHSVSTIQESQQIILNKRVGIVFSDYLIGGGTGFELLRMIREKKSNNSEACFILVSSNISQTSIVKAAEEEIDSFIIKPYTIQSIEENLILVVVRKVNQSDYLQKIEEGKSLISEGKYDAAISVLESATPLHNRPSVALFYAGQAAYLQNQLSRASDLYSEGLSYNSIHYNCLCGLYEILVKEENYSEAYNLLKKIAVFYPSNSNRLMQIIRLAVRTQNYTDIESYYKVFISLEMRTQLLTNYIGSGMYVAGKHFLQNGDSAMALHYFEKIALSCAEFTKFLRAIISLLIEFQMPHEAERFLDYFDASTFESEDYRMARDLVTMNTTIETY